MLDNPQIGFYIAIVILLVLSGVFSASETAYSSVNAIRLKQMARSDDKAKLALEQVNQYTQVLTPI